MLIYQAYYWDCPHKENKEGNWWKYLEQLLPQIRQAGFNVLYLPPPYKGGTGKTSMGFDPYDYYDLGEYKQKDARETYFGTREQLDELIKHAHALDMKVITELVINHCSGADAIEENLFPGQPMWTRFEPASGRFPRNRECFYPSVFAPAVRDNHFGMPNLCFENPYVTISVIRLVEWLVDEVGFDGFRFDYAAGYDSKVITSITRAISLKKRSRDLFFFAEYWKKDEEIIQWLNMINQPGEYPVSALDFDLRYSLKQMCEHSDFDLKRIVSAQMVFSVKPSLAVTFVENHDTAHQDEITANKILAYSFILLHQGFPVVFMKDFRPDMESSPHMEAMRQLLRLRADFGELAPSRNLICSEGLYVMSRTIPSHKREIIYLLNNSEVQREVQAELEIVPASVAVKAVYSSMTSNSEAAWPVSFQEASIICNVPPRGYVVCSAESQEVNDAA